MLLEFTVLGLGLGAIYALLALGLVLFVAITKMQDPTSFLYFQF